MYVCQLSLLQLLLWASYRHFYSFCCCLQTCNFDVVFLVMYCMYTPAFIVTSADISQLGVYLLIYCLRLFVVVYKHVMFMSVGDIVLHMCTNVRGHLC